MKLLKLNNYSKTQIHTIVANHVVGVSVYQKGNFGTVEIYTTSKTYTFNFDTYQEAEVFNASVNKSLEQA